MSGLNTYKGVEILSSPASAEGGRAISDNFEILADRVPFLGGTSAPDADKDDAHGYSVGSLWVQSAASGQQTMWVCTDNTDENATWEIVYDRTSSAMAIGGSDDVGVGTSTPSADLHLYRDDGNTIYLMESSNAAIQHLKIGTDYSTFSNVSGKTRIGNEQNASTKHIVVGNSVGDVGIGTDDPSADLHVYRPGNAICRVNGTNAGWFSILSNTDYSTISNVDNKTRIGTENNASTTHLVIDSSGDVGIGTASPATKLDVNGAATINGNVDIDGVVTLNEESTPTQPATGKAVLYLHNNGGDQELRIKFDDDTVRIIATQV